MKTRIPFLAALLILICLLFSSCNTNQPGTKNQPVGGIIADQQGEGESAAGILHPCHWTFTVEQDTPGEAVLVSTAKIDPGWHLYSQHISEKGSPSLFTYDPSPDYKLVGSTEEGAAIRDHDPYLKIDLFYFEHEAVFRQKIRVRSKKDFTITGTINHTACKTQCVTNEDDLSFVVRGTP